jgi:tetratricopeptide (TPR) repeat protein
MRHRCSGLSILLAVSLLTGCAGPYGKARSALVEGRYEEAASRFEELLARRPDRLDALVGLGKAKYKLAAFDDAITVLTRAAVQAPKSESAHLYLGLSYLQKGDDGPAEDHLKALLGLAPHPRLAAQTNRALELMRSDHLSKDVRAFIAASLEDEAAWAREIRRAAEYAYPPPPFYWSRPFGPCFATRRGLLMCY